MASTTALLADTAQGTLEVRIKILEGCVVQTGSGMVTNAELDFGTHVALDSDVDASTSQSAGIEFQCTDNTPYQVGLSNGAHADGDKRRMMAEAGSAYIGYELYQDAGRTQRWGSTPGVDTVDGTADGTVTKLAVYGRVPAGQAKPGAGDYSDTVTVTVTY